VNKVDHGVLAWPERDHWRWEEMLKGMEVGEVRIFYLTRAEAKAVKELVQWLRETFEEYYPALQIWWREIQGERTVRFARTR